VFGDLPVTAVTTNDVAAVMAAHPRDLRAKTRGDTYQRLRRLFDLAIFPMRLRPAGSNPVVRYLRPERDPDKLFCFLYPTEAVALLRGTDANGKVVVPICRRVLYVLATYTGQRKGSLYALCWKHLDLKHGTLASFKTKTGRAQYFVADPGLFAVLKAWRVLCGWPGDDEPIVTDADVAYDRKRLATALRDDLKAVGVTRSLRFEEDAPNVEALRFHDLRSTFCTWARRAGKSDAWISERTGHELSCDMINRYDPRGDHPGGPRVRAVPTHRPRHTGARRDGRRHRDHPLDAGPVATLRCTNCRFRSPFRGRI
jgi:integrase